VAARKEWRAVAPEDAGFEPDLAERLDARAGEGVLTNVHAVLVVRGGALALERYYAGADEAWGRDLGHVKHGPGDLHDLRSISKSVVGLLYGIALADGLVPAPDHPLLESFPEYRDLAAEPARRRLTVGHALTMTLGLEWNEDLPYTDPRNGEIAMERAPDRYRFVLERPIAEPPGQRWTYCGGATALLGGLIARGAGRTLTEFARERLFAPLGIDRFEWITGRDGVEAAASGLRLRPRDLARLGHVVNRDGSHDGTQLILADWLAKSFRPRVDAIDLGYGYQGWLGKLLGSGQPWMGAFGNGGQRLFLAPSLDLAIVVMAGNYNRPEAWKLPVAVVAEVVMPALRRRTG
jgi:CubicO group peptidase (beta-lactamase class C family)